MCARPKLLAMEGVLLKSVMTGAWRAALSGGQPRRAMSQ
jgi:hypothetical protein